ncbi:MAG: hypothetical protein IPP43_05775 [Chitinophagaceae bacterium]|nr:hypothetical protein [Chitinophagaceae bacterium]
MFKKLLLIALLFTGLVACKSKGAFNYSQSIVAKEKSLEPEIRATEKNVEKYLTAAQYDSVAIAGEKWKSWYSKKSMRSMPLVRS